MLQQPVPPPLLLADDVLVAHLVDPELGPLFTRSTRRTRWLRLGDDTWGYPALLKPHARVIELVAIR